MLKKTITYKDFNDEETTEVFFFHLSRAELVELEMSKEGGFVESMKASVAADDRPEIVREMKKIILLSYGQKTPDGKRFIKNERLREEFESSQAFETLFMQLVTDTDSAIEFFQGIIPTELQQQATAALSPNGAVEVKNEDPPRRLSRADMIEMSNEELQTGLASGKFIIDS